MPASILPNWLTMAPSVPVYVHTYFLSLTWGMFMDTATASCLFSYACISCHWGELYMDCLMASSSMVVVVVAYSSLARILEEGHLFPTCTFFFFLKWRLACAWHFHFLGQDQSTVVQRAKMAVAECSLISCVWACPLGLSSSVSVYERTYFLSLKGGVCVCMYIYILALKAGACADTV